MFILFYTCILSRLSYLTLSSLPIFFSVLFPGRPRAAMSRRRSIHLNKNTHLRTEPCLQLTTVSSNHRLAVSYASLAQRGCLGSIRHGTAEPAAA